MPRGLLHLRLSTGILDGVMRALWLLAGLVCTPVTALANHGRLSVDGPNARFARKVQLVIAALLL